MRPKKVNTDFLLARCVINPRRDVCLMLSQDKQPPLVYSYLLPDYGLIITHAPVLDLGQAELN